MKHIILLGLFFCITATSLNAQTGIGTTTPDASAKLDVSSTSKGFLPPRMTSSQRTGISSPASGLMVYQTDGTAGLYYYGSSGWIYIINSTTNVVAVVNGGTGTTTSTGTGSVVLSTNPTLTSIITPVITGGTSTTQSLTFKPTSGNGTTGADHIFQVGNNGGTEAMRILNNGNVGIGTTAPSAKLNISGGGVRIFNGFANNSTSRPAINTSTVGNYEIRGVGGGGGATQADGGDDGFLRLSAGGGGSAGAQSSIDLTGYSNVADMLNNIVMRTAGTERARIDNVGNVGIGTSSPTVKLQVNGDIIANSIAGSSDLRFKSNIRPVTNALDKIKALRGVYFNWNQNDYPDRQFGSNIELGFIAQEVEKIIPEIVTKDKTKDEFRSIKYDKLVALLVEAIKEQQKQIDSLKFEVKRKINKK
jgi:hypothetical protein